MLKREINPVFSIGAGWYYDLCDVDFSKLVKDISNRKRINNTYNEVGTDTYVFNSSEMSDIKAYCTSCINDYGKSILQYNVDLEITQSWVNYTNKEQSHHCHNHSNSILSGVFYLSDNNAPITFVNPLSHQLRRITLFDIEEIKEKNLWNIFNSFEWGFVPKKYSVVIFPSWLEHFVPTQTTDQVRLSIAFNSWIKPGQVIGDEHSKTALTI